MTQKEKDFCEALANLMDSFGITMRVITLVDDPYCYSGAFVTFAEENKDEQTTASLRAFDERAYGKNNPAGDIDGINIFTSADIRNHIEELTERKRT